MYLFPGVEKGGETGEEEVPGGSQGLLLPSFVALKTGGAPGGRSLECPDHLLLCPLTSHLDPHAEFGDSKLVLTLSSPLP